MFQKKDLEKNAARILKKGWIKGYFPLELFDSLKRQQLISPGFLLTIILLISPIVIWLSYQPQSISNPIIALAKFNAFMAISTLSINFILSTRLKVLERLFFGLDRMYRVHKFIGRSSLLFIILHPIFLMINTFPNISIITTYILPIGEIDIVLGVIAVYLFLFLITLTVAIKIPYHFWHNSHRLLGLVLIFAGIHALVAGSDINSYFYLQFVVALYVIFGVICWLYMLLLFKRIGPKYEVKIDHIESLGDVTDVYFKKPFTFDFEPGQYIFIRFPRFEGYKELFPFSISTDPGRNLIRLSIKKSGDYTKTNIPRLKKNDKAIIMGPYGRFGHRYLQHDNDMLWIAGGIGITPFLSFAKQESLFGSNKKIHLIWVIRNKKEAFHDAELHKESLKNKNFNYVHWFSDEKGRITSSDIVKMIGGKRELRNRVIFMCGPPAMMYSLCNGFRQYDISYRNIIFEDFNMLD